MNIVDYNTCEICYAKFRQFVNIFIHFKFINRDNILYGLDDGVEISEEEFQKVIEEAHVSEFAKTLPDGLNTLVGQRGLMLSGGQKQRVAIARALIKVNKSFKFFDKSFNAPLINS